MESGRGRKRKKPLLLHWVAPPKTRGQCMSNGFQSVVSDYNSSTIHYFWVAQAFLKNILKCGARCVQSRFVAHPRPKRPLAKTLRVEPLRFPVIPPHGKLHGTQMRFGSLSLISRVNCWWLLTSSSVCATDLPHLRNFSGGANPPDNHQHGWGLLNST